MNIHIINAKGDDMPQYQKTKTVQFIYECCDQPMISSESYCQSVLRELAKIIGMTPILGPYSTHIRELFNGKENGVSAFLMIAESHIAIHCWSFYRSALIVVCSCKDFDIHVVEEFLSRVLRSKRKSIGEIVMRDDEWI
jgi:S-adenosylmethionine/arginine decarboxylase-like enzyme